ncbi:Neuronal acetylcholine receptor subunit alpha-6 [Mizuhopecten yessoensis]|uniref:Neuronal acetylcholine receptor subunit alpha-6 n=1 Tax=Mizuhopecten yessoensis TaxID=6573 RepID=A0A210Q885_MIZYE|nr:Neuronal acetylcholine receptor subunit alpha-6 [Mizuhopecten yessoensis]
MAQTCLILMLLLLCHVIFPSVTAMGTMDDIIQLNGDLFSNYSKDLRPVYNLSDTVHVDISLFLIAILNFDEVSGTIRLSTVVTINWIDYRLKWNSSEYGIVNYIANSSRVWKPRIFMLSSADDLVEFGDSSFNVRVWSTGMVDFNPGKLIKSSCDIDMTYFPTDSHVCSILIVPWMDTIQEVKLHFTSSTIMLDFFTPHGAWEVYKTSINNNFQLSTDVSLLECTIYLRRKPQYFFLSMGIPVLLLCFLNPFVFLLPAASGERISFAVTMFLSMAVYMSSIGEVMPKVSDPIAGASYFLLGTMCFSCLLILLTILSLCCDVVRNVEHFPRWVIAIVRCRANKKECNKNERDGFEQATSKKKCNESCENQESAIELTQTTNDEIQTIDVTKVIDKSLFWITEAIVLAGVAFYVLVYVRFY